MHIQWPGLILGLGLCVAAVPALADRGEDHDEARHAVEAGEILPLPRILERVRRDYPGQVLDVELEQEAGLWVYEIRVLQVGGRLIRLDVDARSGDIRGRGRHGRPGKGGGR